MILIRCTGTEVVVKRQPRTKSLDNSKQLCLLRTPTAVSIVVQGWHSHSGFLPLLLWLENFKNDTSEQNVYV